MGRGCGMGDQALCITEIIADAHQLESVLKTKGGGLAALDLEGKQRGTAAHLPLRNVCLRVVGTAGIDQPGNLGMLDERHRERCGRIGLPPHAHGKSLQSLEQHPGIEGRKRGAGLANEIVHVIGNEFFGAQNNAA